MTVCLRSFSAWPNMTDRRFMKRYSYWVAIRAIAMLRPF